MQDRCLATMDCPARTHAHPDLVPPSDPTNLRQTKGVFAKVNERGTAARKPNK